MATVPEGQKFATAIGEQRTVTLKDGSLMYLNAHSATRVRFNGDARDIELLEGEAMFQVAQDRLRPFRVHTKDAVVRAVGTRFNVNARSTRTIVSVLEGKVEVSSEAKSTHDTREPLSAGEAAEVTREGRVRRHPGTDVTAAAAWRQRQLVFSKTALEDVAADFNRFHEKGRLLLQDVQPGSHHYTGTFSADDVASFAALLEREPDLRVTKSDGDYFVGRVEAEDAPAH